MYVTAPSLRRLAEFFPRLSDVDRRALRNAMRSATTPDRVDSALELANSLLRGFGVEALRSPEHWHGRYYCDISALYVNMGDSYGSTILYDVDRDRFFATTFGDYVDTRPQGHFY